MMKKEVFKFRRGTIQNVNLVTGRIETWHVFRFTSPICYKKAYGCVNGEWKWLTKGERDDALRVMKRRCS